MAIKVDVLLNIELVKNYKDFEINPTLNLRRKISIGLDNCKNDIEDKDFRKIIYHFYDALSEYCQIVQNMLDCSNLGKVTEGFQELLRNKTGQEYKIRLIADGNI